MSSRVQLNATHRSARSRASVAAAVAAALCLLTAGPGAMGTAPVADAAMRGDRAAVHALLKRGADVTQPHGDGMTALHWAASRGDVELARTLLASGATVNATTRIDRQTPLHVAGAKGDAAIVGLLLGAGADVNATTVVGTTPLMLAAAAGPADAVTALLAAGADPNAKEVAKYHTALMFAAAAHRTEAVKALLKGGADSTATTKVFDLMVVDISADWNTLNNADSKARQAAAAAGAPGEAKGAGMRPLEFNELVAAQGGLTALNLAARQGYRDTAAALIAGGANVNQVSAGVQLSPLLIAIINGQFDLAVDLLDQGADPNAAAENGVAPLYAVLGCRWSMKAQYPQPRAFLQQKTSHVDLLKVLLDHGALPNTRLKKKVWYNGYTQDTTGIDEAGATAFWRAAQASDVPAMRVLLAGGADPALPTKPTTRPGPADDADSEVGPGVSPLLAATGAGFLQAFAGNGRRGDAAGWMPAVRYLVDELHADVNQRDHDGNTALHYAAARGDNEMVNYLVAKGADVKAINRRGQTTVDAANGPRQRINPFPETIEILEKLGAKNNHQCVSC